MERAIVEEMTINQSSCACSQDRAKRVSSLWRLSACCFLSVQMANVISIFFSCQVDIEGDVYSGEHGACDQFTVARIPKTNVFVVKVKSKLCLINRESCPCEGFCVGEDCECPCTSPMNYDICKAELLSGQ